MKRSIPAGIATAIGLAALLSFKSSPVTVATSASAQSVKPTTPAATAPPTSSNTTPDTAPAGTAAPATTPTTGASTTRTIDGEPFANEYGTVQVQVTLQGNQITAVTALQMPVDRQRSAEISQQAEPLLRQETLQAQNAQIDLVGGASYTSQSYAQSLQSALDRA